MILFRSKIHESHGITTLPHLELREVVPEPGIHRRAERSKLEESSPLHPEGTAGCHTLPRWAILWEWRSVLVLHVGEAANTPATLNLPDMTQHTYPYLAAGHPAGWVAGVLPSCL